MARHAKKSIRERGYADSIAVAIFAGILIMIAIIYAVARLGQASAPRLAQPDSVAVTNPERERVAQPQ
ncbi:MAG TPA: hypothetical protein VGH44_02760 [Candidatus Saccharimonadia bacterium]